MSIPLSLADIPLVAPLAMSLPKADENTVLAPFLHPEGCVAPYLDLHAAREADGAATTGFALATARIAARERPVLWVRHSMLDRETGVAYAPGLAAFGMAPARLILVQARDAAAVLQAGLEGARCPGLGAVVIELWGDARLLDLTASRRLALAAKASGTALVFNHIAATPQASAAEARWQVAALPSRPLAGHAPGHPTFLLTLQRHRAGYPPGTWSVEWNCDEYRFSAAPFSPVAGRESAPPLSGAVVPLPLDRPGTTPEPAGLFRRAG
ncbi:MAG: hypothetical protein CFE31_16355 [Rhizobiales bacterium PAR1]|nr:MAG: hypothetical protein CFE31_16355 [Rhizobiales bacterium PAR1]